MMKILTYDELFKRLGKIFGDKWIRPFKGMDPRKAHYLSYDELTKLEHRTDLDPRNKRQMIVFFKTMMKVSEMMILNKGYTFPEPPNVEVDWDQYVDPMKVELMDRWLDSL